MGRRARQGLRDRAGVDQDDPQPEFRALRPRRLRTRQSGPGHLLHEHRAPRVGDGLPGEDLDFPCVGVDQQQGMTVMDSISRLLKPRSVAVIGASADATKTAGRPVSYLVKHGYTGAIYPVNPKVERIGSLACYRDVASLPEAPDVGIVLLGAERAHLAVQELAKRGTAAAIVLASGYTETGEVGAQRQKQLIEAAGSMRILGPNSIGLVNLTDNIVLSATGALEMEHFPVGGIGVVSQSGGILGALLSRAAPRGIGLSKLISTSNEVDLELSDFIDHLADDDATKVIALYIETVRNPAKFRAAALKAARNGKPVVAFKIGRSEAGAKAAVSYIRSAPA